MAKAKDFKERFTKDLYSHRPSKQKPYLTTVLDEAAQARHVAEQVLTAREAGVLLKSQAVLFRASHHSAQLEVELAQRNVPFVKYGGLKFLEAAHVKDVISILRWCENVRDKVAGFRVLQLLPGIGPTTAAKVLAVIENQPYPLKRLWHFDISKAAAEDWHPFLKLVAAIRNGKHGWPAEFGIIRVWYEPYLLQEYDDNHARAADLVQLEQIAAGFASRQKFLTDLTLDPPEATTGTAQAALPDEDYLILSTIHSAKGLEWKMVHILDVVDGCIPSDMATSTADQIEEERRLLYVAMTRAKDELNLIVPQRFYTRQQWTDAHVYGSVSRFIPPKIRPLFHCRHWSDSKSQSIATKSSGLQIDVADRLKRRWA